MIFFSRKYLDIGGYNKGFARRLSNFTERKFIFDGIECNSMEGLLQSFKFKEKKSQIIICKLVGYEAKNLGKEKDKTWKKEQILWWNNKKYKRNSKEYQKLLDRAYISLSENKDFIKDLLLTKNFILTHKIGKSNKKDTVLTEKEFCTRLMKIRKIYNKKMS